jgi:porin
VFFSVVRFQGLGTFSALALSGALLVFAPNALAQESSSLGQLGVAPAALYDGAAFDNLAGGLHRRAVYSGNLSLRLSLDLERLTRWSGATFYASGVWIHGGQPSVSSGDAQGVSNISAAPAAQLEELWLQQNSASPALSGLVGLFDPSREFYRLQAAGLFLNGSFGTGPEFSQSGSAGPGVFPNTSLGVRFAYKPDRRFLVRAALLDGAPLRRPNGSLAAFRARDGELFLSEVAFLQRPAPDRMQPNRRFRLGRFSNLPPYDHKLAFGAWHYTATFDDLSELQSDGRPVPRHGSSGAYLITEVLLKSGDEKSQRRQSAFVQLGISDARSSRFGSYFGAGVVASAVASESANDELGLAIAVARNGSHFVEAQREQGLAVERAEITMELTYLVQLSRYLGLQPDVQYVVHPNTDPQLEDTLAATLRFELATAE